METREEPVVLNCHEIVPSSINKPSILGCNGGGGSAQNSPIVRAFDKVPTLVCVRLWIIFFVFVIQISGKSHCCCYLA